MKGHFCLEDYGGLYGVWGKLSLKADRVLISQVRSCKFQLGKNSRDMTKYIACSNNNEK